MRKNWRDTGLKEVKCSDCGGPTLKYRILATLLCDACARARIDRSQKERSRRSYLKHYEEKAAFRKEHAEEIAAFTRKYYRENREACSAKHKEYNKRPEVIARRRERDAANEELKRKKSEWHKAHPPSAEARARNNEWRIRTGWSNKRYHERFPEDLGYRLKFMIRNRVRAAIKGKFKAGSAVESLGCTATEAITHLESQFKPGMTWDNWGRKGWHIDHIRPLSSFNLEDPTQFAQACHYTNLQPLWATENRSKGAKV